MRRLGQLAEQLPQRAASSSLPASAGRAVAPVSFPRPGFSGFSEAFERAYSEPQER